MRTYRISRLTAAVAALAVGLASCGGSSPDDTSLGTTTTAPSTTTTVPPEYETPIVFVHGFLGTAAQYRTVALHFASNGFPANRIRGYDYYTGDAGSRPDPGAFGSLSGQAIAGLQTFVEKVRDELKVQKVRLVGHSLGTGVLTAFMGDQARAAHVDKWVLVDGVACPADTPSCLEIRASALDQTHVEAATSKESFAKQYEFFIGRAPRTTRIEPEAPEAVEIAGKALHLQNNRPPTGATGEIYEINSTTGARVGAKAGSFTVGEDGSWGPIKVNGTKHYEIALQAEAGGRTLHLYYQPFIRSSYLVRLVTAEEESYTATNTNSGPGHSTVVVTRYREWWTSRADRSDTLEIQGQGQPKVDVLAPIKAQGSPGALARGADGTIGIHIHDDKETPGQTTSVLLEPFKDQGFQAGVDIFLPAASPPTGTITVTNVPRGDRSKVQTMVAPNWPSSTDPITFEFNDYVQ